MQCQKMAGSIFLVGQSKMTSEKYLIPIGTYFFSRLSFLPNFHIFKMQLKPFNIYSTVGLGQHEHCPK